MKKGTLLVITSCLLSLGALTSCGSKADVNLTVYNWEDYIYEGTDEKGNKVEDSAIEAFEKYYQEQTGKTIKVNYKTFSTNEEMYTKLSKGLIKADLCCPSDYMIQKMQGEGMLESFGFDSKKNEYTEGLDNVNDYLSPYIKDLFIENKFSDFAVPYFWGTMGYTYNPEFVSEEQVSSWDFQWNPGNDLKGNSLKKKITIKDSVRDTYFTAVMHVYKDEVASIASQYEEGALTAEQYNSKLSEIFNRHDKDTMTKVENALNALTDNVILEVDEGKSDMVLGKIYANLAWSGDSVFAMDEAENDDVYLNYMIPEEGSNVWFDGWCMPKGANIEASKMFLDFMSDPEIAAMNMDAVGYTSVIAGDAIWETVMDWYSADIEGGEYEEADCDECDLSYFFKGTLSEGTEAKIMIAKEERGRQFDAQYPSEEVITRCAIMKDFGADGNEALYKMWNKFTASF